MSIGRFAGNSASENVSSSVWCESSETPGSVGSYSWSSSSVVYPSWSSGISHAFWIASCATSFALAIFCLQSPGIDVTSIKIFMRGTKISGSSALTVSFMYACWSNFGVLLLFGILVLSVMSSFLLAISAYVLLASVLRGACGGGLGCCCFMAGNCSCARLRAVWIGVCVVALILYASTSLR